MEKENNISKIGNIVGKTKNVIFEVEIENYEVYKTKDVISIYMKIKDETGFINALLVSESDDEIEEFINSLDIRKKYKEIIKCQLRGNISIVDQDMYNDLNNKDFKINNFQVGDKVLIIKSIKNIGFDYDTLFGKSIFYLHECELDELYQLIKDNTNYLKHTDFNEISDIQITDDKGICVLFKNGVVQNNGKDCLSNINCLWFNCGNIYAISNDKVITAVNYKDDMVKYLNYNNYKYKKIIINPLSITALTFDGEIKMVGFIVNSGMDYNRFINVDDIGFDKEKNEVVVIQNNEIKSLFISVIDAVYDESQIILSGKNSDKDNCFEIV